MAACAEGGSLHLGTLGEELADALQDLVVGRAGREAQDHALLCQARQVRYHAVHLLLRMAGAALVWCHPGPKDSARSAELRQPHSSAAVLVAASSKHVHDVDVTD